MRKSLAPDLPRVVLALTAAAIVLFVPVSWSTILVIAIAAIAGLLLFRTQPLPPAEPIPRLLPRSAGIAAAAVAAVLLLVSAIATLFPTAKPGPLALFSAFYRAGALVFGGGHVVLPLLQNTVVAPGWVPLQSFLSGYGAAQALPGPLFSFAAYLGAVTHGSADLPATSPFAIPILYGLIALIGLFAPGLLAMVAVLPFWTTLRTSRKVRAALQGVNAAVLGILLAALVRPLWTTTVHTPTDFLIALWAFALLVFAKLPSWLVVFLTAATEAALHIVMHT
jgi:chromate transporter